MREVSENIISNLSNNFLLSFVTSKDAYKKEAKNKVSSRKCLYNNMTTVISKHRVSIFMESFA